ncbi:hypothetical protein BC936DRAFT_141244 [Jimgerdemannia flammicorona]|uniref:Uncharacterized protein n=1 Tax=Jimgerdemannia flammicorona TaxID=994334 RepID=A0A433DMQ5_9FUNG|nr:hypothetical protein BC936DRAFT_141244 [Jimgerdemannia flammicorona]
MYGLLVKNQSKPRSRNIGDLQRRGNEQFNRKEYVSAIDSCTQALELEPDAVLLSNRVQVHLQLKQFGKALECAEMALKLDAGNPKARFRQFKALNATRSYEEACISLKMLSRATAETQELSRRTRQRLEEQRYGRYDVIGILQEASSTCPPYLDHSDYVGPVRVTEIPGKGRGIVATKEIGEGTLILCSKAFALYGGTNMPPMSTNRTNATEAAEIDIARITNTVVANSFAIHGDLWPPLFSQQTTQENRP